MLDAHLAKHKYLVNDTLTIADFTARRRCSTPKAPACRSHPTPISAPGSAACRHCRAGAKPRRRCRRRRKRIFSIRGERPERVSLRSDAIFDGVIRTFTCCKAATGPVIF